MSAIKYRVGLCIALCVLAACSKSDEAASSGAGVAAAPPSGAVNRAKERAMLAYEHEVSIALVAEAIPARLQASRTACETARFGDCVVLGVSEQGGKSPDASLIVRIAPAGVEPMIRLAAHDGEVDHRTTHAEDLAATVRDNDTDQLRLNNERERLLEFQQRRDLTVADMIALSAQLAAVDALLQTSRQDGAQHRMRIDTQLLTLRFDPPDTEHGSSQIGSALRESGALLETGTAWLIRALAFLLPLIIASAVMVTVIRNIRRRRRDAARR